MRRHSGWVRLVASSALALAALAAAAPTRAEPVHDPAAAQQLFDRGKELQTAGDWAAACGKFEASMELNPATGTLIRIARCHEHEGKLARAWADYQAALTLNRTLPGQTDQRSDELRLLVEKELAALGPRVPKLRVVMHGVPPGLRLSRDGQDLPVATLGEDLPIDPGRVEIIAEAPGYVTVRREVVAVEGQAALVEITLERPEVVPSGDTTRVLPLEGRAGVANGGTIGPTKLGGPRIAGLVVGGAGVVGLGVAVGFGVDTLSKVRASSPFCTPANMCMQTGLDLRAAAGRSQTAGLVSLAVGGAFVATGIVMFVTAPPRAGAPAPLAVIVGPSGGALSGLW